MPNIKKDEYDDIPLGDEDSVKSDQSTDINLNQPDNQDAAQRVLLASGLVPPHDSQVQPGPQQTPVEIPVEIPNPMLLTNLSNVVPDQSKIPLGVDQSGGGLQPDENIKVVDIDSFVQKIINKDLNVSLKKK